MKLIPSRIDRTVQRFLEPTVVKGTMPTISPLALSILTRLPRLGNLQALMWRVNACSSPQPEESQLQAIWPRVTPESDWAIPAQGIIWLWELCRRLRPRRILEVGSGISTLVFSAFHEQYREELRGGGSVVSLEHDPKWLGTTKSLLDDAGHKSRVEFLELNLDSAAASPREWAFPKGVLDKVAELASDEGFDLCLIDGPPAHQFGRTPTLPALLPYVRRGGVFVLDDACRTHELSLCRSWQSRYAKHIQWRGLAPIGHGFAVFDRM
jgi:predicted O-methyltransferase YrrM